MPTLRIRDWKEIYENNRTRELKRMEWVPMPNRMDGSGYTELLEHENGAAHFGAWVAIVEIASRCEPRGTLLRESRTSMRDRRTAVRDGLIPHDERSLSRISRIPVGVFEEVIPRLLSIGWIEEIEDPLEFPHEGAEMPQEDAGSPHFHASSRARGRTRDERNGTERNGTESGGGAPAETEKKAACESSEEPPPTTAELRRQIGFAAGALGPSKRTAAAAEVELHEWARGALMSYPAAQRLPGHPDDAITRECLEIARGDPKVLSGALVAMHKAGKAPATSWKWFPTVLRQYAGGPQ